MQEIQTYSATEESPTQWASMRRAGLPAAALLGAVLLWGGSFSCMRFVLQSINPWSTMWLRMAIALVLILPLAGRLRRCQYRRGDWKLLLPMVLFQPCFYFSLESNALKLTTSSQAGVIAASVPLLVGLGAFLLLGESISRRSIIGLALSIGGVVGLTLMQADQQIAVNPMAGNALEMGAMICATGNMLLIKKLSRRYNAWTLTAMQVIAGAIFFLPGLWFLLDTEAARLTPSLIHALIFLGAFVTLGAFGLYNWGMSQIPAGKAAIFINLVPVIAVLMGWLVMNEVLTTGQWLATLAVIGGVGVSQSASSPKAEGSQVQDRNP